MPSPSAIAPVLEGMIGYLTTSSAGGQEPSTWVEALKLLMRNFYRDETDWQFVLADDVDQTANVIDAGATHLAGVLVEQDSADAERDWVVATDADSNTFDGTAALDNDDVLVIQPRAAATDNTGEYIGVALYPPLVLDTGLSLGADGRDGTDPAADDIRAWVLYRNVVVLALSTAMVYILSGGIIA